MRQADLSYCHIIEDLYSNYEVVHALFEHDFNSLIYKTKVLKLSEILVALFLSINVSPCN